MNTLKLKKYALTIVGCLFLLFGVGTLGIAYMDWKANSSKIESHTISAMLATVSPRHTIKTFHPAIQVIDGVIITWDKPQMAFANIGTCSNRQWIVIEPDNIPISNFPLELNEQVRIEYQALGILSPCTPIVHINNFVAAAPDIPSK